MQTRGNEKIKYWSLHTIFMFVRLLDRVQQHPNTVDCSYLLVGINLVHIVLAGMFSTDVMDWYVYVV